MQLTQSVQSPDTNNEKQSLMHRITMALTETDTQIAMVTGAFAGLISGDDRGRRVVQMLLGRVVPLVAFVYLDGE